MVDKLKFRGNIARIAETLFPNRAARVGDTLDGALVVHRFAIGAQITQLDKRPGLGSVFPLEAVFSSNPHGSLIFAEMSGYQITGANSPGAYVL